MIAPGSGCRCPWRACSGRTWCAAWDEFHRAPRKAAHGLRPRRAGLGSRARHARRRRAGSGRPVPGGGGGRGQGLAVVDRVRALLPGRPDRRVAGLGTPRCARRPGAASGAGAGGPGLAARRRLAGGRTPGHHGRAAALRAVPGVAADRRCARAGDRPRDGGADRLLAVPRAVRRLPGSRSAGFHRPFHRCRARAARHPALRDGDHHRDPRGQVPGRRGLRRLAFPDRRDRVRRAVRLRHLPQRVAAGGVHRGLRRGAGARQRGARARHRGARSHPGQRGGRRSRPRGLWLAVLLHRDPAAAAARPAVPPGFGSRCWGHPRRVGEGCLTCGRVDDAGVGTGPAVVARRRRGGGGRAGGERTGGGGVAGVAGGGGRGRHGHGRALGRFPGGATRLQRRRRGGERPPRYLPRCRTGGARRGVSAARRSRGAGGLGRGRGSRAAPRMRRPPGSSYPARTGAWSPRWIPSGRWRPRSGWTGSRRRAAWRCGCGWL